MGIKSIKIGRKDKHSSVREGERSGWPAIKFCRGRKPKKEKRAYPPLKKKNTYPTLRTREREKGEAKAERGEKKETLARVETPSIQSGKMWVNVVVTG